MHSFWAVGTKWAAGFAVFVAAIGGAQDASVQPAPRFSDGKPDLTGVYQASNRHGPEWDAQVPGEVPGQPAQSNQPSKVGVQR